MEQKQNCIFLNQVLDNYIKNCSTITDFPHILQELNIIIDLLKEFADYEDYYKSIISSLHNFKKDLRKLFNNKNKEIDEQFINIDIERRNIALLFEQKKRIRNEINNFFHEIDNLALKFIDISDEQEVDIDISDDEQEVNIDRQRILSDTSDISSYLSEYEE